MKTKKYIIRHQDKRVSIVIQELAADESINHRIIRLNCNVAGLAKSFVSTSKVTPLLTKETSADHSSRGGADAR